MTILMIAWAVCGVIHWVKRQGDMPLLLGIVGDVFIGLPLCILFGPIPLISNWFER